MRTIRGFFPEINKSLIETEISGEYYNYFKNVLRLKKGDLINLFNNKDSLEYITKINNISNKHLTINIIDSIKIEKENNYNINLYQSIIKNENFDLVVQKATELGVNNIIPIVTDRTNHKFDHKHFDKKIDRWQKIAINASEQCGRVFIPKIHNIINLFEINLANALNIVLCPYTKNKENNIELNIISNNSFNIFIGPEGGFTDEEVKFINNQNNSLTMNLGDRILKSETAHISLISIINFLKQK
ncbi:16S rRNA (uracil(1498)-N(3))-methyltransferase [Pseudofrancisella aestuarii]|uniref:Ribosomal RNA small subunit methyltransferase E n=1 Tax=Pseudofrancisella aestuarii TaxID=2670347 RepID=A0ABV9T9T7_9GAMM|nr:RsmE family RNA methyltransferase [Pseudofrancisella aestuarii]